jgi:hypothetical protein
MALLPSPPVDTLLDLAEENGLNRIQLAEFLNISDDYLTNLINRVYPITYIAPILDELNWGSIEFWTNRHNNYIKAMEQL